ncbi:MAG: hypothetical protein PHV55_01670 [Candidatus Omnitrophica bacterium]|nr:hypothetical protein [Candidatus Omnitrophota bacterium]
MLVKKSISFVAAQRKDIFSMLCLGAVCIFFVYIFHFDVFLSSDSAWAAIVELQLIRDGLGSLSALQHTHGVLYLFGYYVFQCGILKLLHVSPGNIMQSLNVINGFLFAANIILLYLLLRKLSFNRMLSVSLSLLYFFMPLVFHLSLYTTSVTCSLFFFILSNIFFVSYLTDSKKINLLFVFFFSLAAIVMRADAFLFYFSFISLAILEKKSLKKAFFIYMVNIGIMFIGFLVAQKIFLGEGVYHRLVSEAHSFSEKISFNLIFMDFVQLSVAMGIGLVLTGLFFLTYRMTLRDFRIPCATLIWLLPMFLYVLFFPAIPMAIVRLASPAFIGLILLIGKTIESRTPNNIKQQFLFILLIYCIHFATMPLSYYLVKQYYHLRRAYKPGERIVVDHLPLGNIFVNAYHLREEKRKAWHNAQNVISNHDKVVVLSDNTNLPSYYYFLYYLCDGIRMRKLENTSSHWVFKNKEFIFIDVEPHYNKEALWQLLNDPRYAEFSIHFALFIPERTPKLYNEIKDFCNRNKREIF